MGQQAGKEKRSDKRDNNNKNSNNQKIVPTNNENSKNNNKVATSSVSKGEKLKTAKTKIEEAQYYDSTVTKQIPISPEEAVEFYNECVEVVGPSTATLPPIPEDMSTVIITNILNENLKKQATYYNPVALARVCKQWQQIVLTWFEKNFTSANNLDPWFLGCYIDLLMDRRAMISNAQLTHHTDVIQSTLSSPSAPAIPEQTEFIRYAQDYFSIPRIFNGNFHTLETEDMIAKQLYSALKKPTKEQGLFLGRGMFSNVSLADLRKINWKIHELLTEVQYSSKTKFNMLCLPSSAVPTQSFVPKLDKEYFNLCAKFIAAYHELEPHRVIRFQHDLSTCTIEIDVGTGAYTLRCVSATQASVLMHFFDRIGVPDTDSMSLLQLQESSTIPKHILMVVVKSFVKLGLLDIAMNDSMPIISLNKNFKSESKTIDCDTMISVPALFSPKRAEYKRWNYTVQGWMVSYVKKHKQVSEDDLINLLKKRVLPDGSLFTDTNKLQSLIVSLIEREFFEKQGSQLKYVA